MNRSAASRLATGEHDPGDVPRRVVAFGVGDPSLDPADAAVFGILPEEAAIERRVEMEGVDQAAEHLGLRLGAAREPAGVGGSGVEAIGVERCVLAEPQPAQPEMLERRRTDRSAGGAEGVNVAAVGAAPADELDAELVRRLRRPHEGVLVDAQHGVDELQLGDRRLTDADDADLVRLDQRDRIVARRQQPRAKRGGHPPRRAAADDDDAVALRTAGFPFAHPLSPRRAARPVRT